MTTKLRMTAEQHAEIKNHLFPGDGLEAVALLLCGRSAALGVEILTVHKIQLIPYAGCGREKDRVNWPPILMENLLREAQKKGYGVGKMHSHQEGWEEFSSVDDNSDLKVFEAVFGWLDGDRPHVSGIMLPDGKITARSVAAPGLFAPVAKTIVVGDDIKVWADPKQGNKAKSFTEKHAQLFGPGTTDLLAKMRIAVVGCSGTGSPVVEQLVRLGVGELVLVDPDRVEDRNLNRILGTTADDARDNRLKVEVIRDHVNRIGLGTVVFPVAKSLAEEQAIKAVASSDFVFGCMDTLSGRNLLARISRYYTLPYVDVGVKLEALSDGTINQVAGSIHYLKPDGLDFPDRGVFTAEMLEAEDLAKTNPEEYKDRIERGYIRGIQVEKPAVISVNMFYASLAVNEMLARIHPYRMDENAQFAISRLSLSHARWEHEPVALESKRIREGIGKGDVIPLLGMPGIDQKRA